MQGEKTGTLFHKDAKQWVSLNSSGAREMAVAARNASRRLQVPVALSFLQYSFLFLDMFGQSEGSKLAQPQALTSS